MYVPKHFAVEDEAEIFTFIDANAFGQLISIEDQRPFASHLPFLSRKTIKHCSATWRGKIRSGSSSTINRC